MRAWIHDGYPGGSRQEFGNPVNLAWKQPPSKLVLHSTEGAGFPSAAVYDDGRRAPHVTVDPWGPSRSWRQHYPLTEAAWALKASSLVSTNTMGAVQVEIIGTCDGRNGALPYVPGIAGEDRAYLVGLLRHIAREAGIPWQAPGLRWISYPESYGTAASQRLTPAAWTAYRGLIGHQHVPGNSHGDPGVIPITAWLATGEPTPTPPPEEDDMTADQAAALNKILDTLTPGEAGKRDAGQVVALIAEGIARTDALAAKVDALALGGVDVDVLAAKVADLLAQRLAS